MGDKRKHCKGIFFISRRIKITNNSLPRRFSCDHTFLPVMFYTNPNEMMRQRGDTSCYQLKGHHVRTAGLSEGELSLLLHNITASSNSCFGHAGLSDRCQDFWIKGNTNALYDRSTLWSQKKLYFRVIVQTTCKPVGIYLQYKPWPLQIRKYVL